MKITHFLQTAFVIGCASTLLASCSVADTPPMAQAAQAAQAAPSSELNLDLEKGFDGWRATEQPLMSNAQPDAAHSGKMGLRIEDKSEGVGSSVFSPQVPATPERTYQLSFWSKTNVVNGGGVWARFYNADSKIIGQAPTLLTNFSNDNGDWVQFKKSLQTPAETAFVAFWIHTSTAAQGTFDFDDFSVTAEGAAPAPAPATVPATLPAPVARKTPAYIIIKADDLITRNDSIAPQWQRFVDFIEARKIKASIGIIANSLEGDSPHYFQWIKDCNATGDFEFWNHGYDHKTWTENGRVLKEFAGPSYAQQKEHLDKSEQLAREKLGFAFTSFGAPFNATDNNTVKALQENPDIKTWLYGDPKTPAGKVVLDRVPQVNIEVTTFVPDALKFAENFNRFSDRDFFVIQGHPEHWSDERFAQFVQIVDFLTQSGAIFVTPSEYVKLKHLS